MPDTNTRLVSEQFQCDLFLLAALHSERDVRQTAAALNWRLVEVNRENRKGRNAKNKSHNLQN